MRFLLRAYFLVGSIVILMAAVLYVRQLSKQARDESNFSAAAISEMVALVLEVREEQSFYVRLRSILDEIALEMPFPMIITDVKGRPLFWRGVPDIPFGDAYTFEELKQIDLWDPGDEKIAELILLARGFRGEGQRVPYFLPGTPRRVQGYVCFGESTLAGALGKGIIIQFFIFLLFLLIGISGYYLLKRFEQESIWVGLAKETAHQMGTPLTSLLGWIQLGQSRLEGRDEEWARPLDESFGEMTRDVMRLQKVSERFNSMGAPPKLKSAELQPVVKHTVAYFRSRLPQHRVQVEIRETYDEVPLVPHHPELLEWVVENLIKNALDSLDKRQGRVSVTLSYNATAKAVELHVRDNGRGISASDRRKVFRPGYSSRAGGWGLGLTLARRIVEEYHGGRLFLLDSIEGHGSCFVMRLPS